jgi:hypothetical protein
LTKIHEILVEYTNDAGVSGRGEFTILVAPASQATKASHTQILTADQLSALLGCLTDQQGLQDADALQLVSRAAGVDEREARKLIKKYRISVKQQKMAGA